MTYLLGVNHTYQHNKNLTDSTEFVRYIKHIIKKRKIDLVAEEWSSDCSVMNNIDKTIPEEICSEKKIPHLYCDPDLKARQKLKIPTRKQIASKLGISGIIISNGEDNKRISAEQQNYHSVREKYWMEQLIVINSKNCLFICGADHLESFNVLLGKSGVESEILQRRFEK